MVHRPSSIVYSPSSMVHRPSSKKEGRLMQALIYNGPHELEIADIAVPAPGPGEVLLDVRAVGICGSDVHGYTGASGTRPAGMVMGHGCGGVVRALGPGVAAPAVGARVAVNPVLYCG